MIRVQVVVEGPTEEQFVKALLTDWLGERNVSIAPMKVLHRSGARGGGRSWQPWKRHLNGLLRQDASRDLRVSTLIDLYGIPRDSPGYDDTNHGAARAEAILNGMAEEIDDRRFIPYIQLHEFESLLFTDLTALSRTDPDVFPPAEVAELADSVKGTAPEDINDNYETAPSRRIRRAFAAFDKVAHGPRAAAETGLPALRAACPRFNAWLTTLERLGAPAP